MKNLYTLMGRTTHKTHESTRSYGSSFGKVAILLVLLNLIFTSHLSAQCTSSTPYGTGAAPAAGASVTLTTCAFAGEYSTITGVLAATAYTSTATGGTGNWITIRRNTPAGAVIAQGNSPLNWTSTTAGTYCQIVNTNSACGTESACHTLTVSRAGAGCTSATLYGTGVAPAPGTTTTLTTCAFAGEYSTITAVLAATAYTSTATGGTGNWITIRLGTTTGTVIAQGNSPLNWTSTTAGTYCQIVNTNSACGTESACHTLAVSRAGAPPTITSFTPTSACGSGVSFVITGTNFTGATAVLINGVGVASFVVNSATQITATTAAGNTTGLVSVVTAGGTANGTTMTIYALPVITTQPATPASFCGASGSATLSVTATGATSYQWKKNGVNISAAPYSGFTSNTLTITNPSVAENGAVLTCVITGAGGCTVTTSPRTVTVANPAVPTGVTATNSTICVGQTSQLNATSAGNVINWYTVPTGGTAIGTSTSGVNFPVTPSVNTTYYAEATNNGPSTTILNSPVSTNTSSGNWTLGYKFTPNTNITVTSFRRFFGSKISIWTDAGVLVASQAVTGTNGVWTDNTLATPVVLTAGTTYRIAAYANSSTYYWAYGLPATFTNGLINGGVINGGVEVAGDAFPSSTDAVGWWFVDLNYYTAGCVSARSSVTVNIVTPVITLQPTAPSQFCGGSGTSTVSIAATGATTYQWMRNGLAITGAPYSNFTTNTLTITNPSVAENGVLLTCVAYSAGGSCSVTSSSVSLVVGNAPTTPSPVTATNSTICVGETSQLNATSAGNYINWYTAATGGTLITTLPSATNYPVSPAATTTYYAESVIVNAGTPVTQTFGYTGAITTWTVPAGVTSVTINAKGAQGGTSTGTGGLGANMTGTFAVTPGQVLSILAGQQPAVNGYPGGGGGTFVALGASYATSTPLIVAGGGSGAQSGAGDNASIGTSGNGPLPGTAGNGAASSSCGGGGGGFFTSGGNDLLYGTAGAAGAGFQQGGAGGISTSGYGPGGFGGGATADYVGSCNVVGGSGGGYSGGSGTGTAYQLFGYGGGSYNAGTSQTNIVGNTGNGQVVISYTPVTTGCASIARQAVTVTVNSAPTANAGAALTGICAGSTSAAMGGSVGGSATGGTWSGGAGTWTNPNNPATATYTAGVSESGIITLTLTTTGSGCTNITVSKTISVNSIPVVNAGADVSICPLASTTLAPSPINCTSLSCLLTAINANQTALLASIPTPYGYVLDMGVNSNYISDGGSDMYDGGNYLNTNLGASINYSDNTVVANAAFGAGGQHFTRAIGDQAYSASAPTVFYWAADLNGVSSVNISGNNGADGSGTQDLNSFNVSSNGVTYSCFLKRVYGAGDPSINHLFMIPQANSATQSMGVTTDDDLHTISGLTGVTRMYYMLYAGNAGATISVPQATTIAQTFANIIPVDGTYSWTSSPVGFTSSVSAPTVTPSATTTYTLTGTLNGCSASDAVLVTVAAPTLATTPATGDMIWKGATNTDWATLNNWWEYNGSAYVSATGAPTNLKNVIIPANQSCVLNQPNTFANSGNAKDLTIEAGATLTMGNGTLVVNGNWINNNVFVAGTGTVQFGGAINTTIGGSAASNDFYNVTMNKTGEALLVAPATISNSLTLTNGNLNIAGFNIDMASNAINGGSAGSYVKTSGSGVLKRDVSGSLKTFPVGNSAYNPAGLTNIGAADNYGVRVIDNVTNDGTGVGTTTSDPAVKRTWMISETSPGGSDVSLQLYWNGVGEEINSFSLANTPYMAHYSAAWDNIGGTVTANVADKSGITSFSPFTIKSTISVLPIELISFQANCAGDKQVDVTWATASEHNTSHFVVEKSRDGLNWTILNTLGAAGNSTTVIEYALTDNDVASGTTYYRLTQFDNDGVSETFNIASVNCGAQQAITSNLVAYPNPSNGSFYIDFYTQDITGPSLISVFDSRGVIIYRQDVLVEKGSNVFHIEDLEAAPGMYYIKVSNGTTTSYIVKHSLR